ncbi:MAG TPA: agmatinase [Candidatus Eremiobacteraeota bacterium]|nr:MAG: N(1)-aminopropylagmatine ureohydrolase [bacterium ADurb.Bin363]HPZ08557.1 agmatinase [Candidatus Eremiobacteraeota bacterium]
MSNDIEVIIVSVPVEEAHVVILPVPYEGTVSGGGGSSRGPSAILEAMKYQLEDYDRFLDSVTSNDINIISLPPLSVEKLSPEEMVKCVRQKADEILSLNKFLLLLGGEHSISIGAIEAVKNKYGSLTVFQIDAHGDLRDDNSDYVKINPSKYAHCSVMKRAIDMGCKTVQTGIRELYSEEINYIRKNSLRVFQCPLKATEEEIISAVETENVYLTIDVDGFDPSLMPETGTPVAGGLEWYTVLSLLKKLFMARNVVACDITEVSPFFPNNLTAKNAAQLAYTITGYRFKNI